MATKTGAGGEPQEYNEQDGRYCFRQNMTYPEILQYFAKKSPDGWKNSEKRKREADSENSRDIPQRPQKAFGFARLKTKHHNQHMVDMGFKDEASYQRAAIEFWESGQGTVYYSVLRKNFAKESPDKSKIVVVETDGTIKTYFPFKTKKARDRYLLQDRWQEVERY